MIPIRDENPTQRVPIITYSIFGLNVLVWLWQFISDQSGAAWLTAAYGLVPRRFMGDPGGEAFTVFLSMFMHGGWAHIGGNLLFLYVFGDNVEDALGRSRYIGFYLISGLVAAAAQIFVDPSSTIPMVGASGAIAGVLGGYMVLYPRAPIVVLNPFFPLWFLFGPVLVFPAWLVMGEWFLMNFFMGAGVSAGADTGVAVFAHIGGFLAGLLLVKPMRLKQRAQSRRDWQGWRRPPRPPGGFGGVGGGQMGGRFDRWPGGSSGRPGRWV